MPGQKPETPKESVALNHFMSSLERGKTVEVRTETLLRGVLKQGNVAQAAGPVAYAAWQQQFALLIPEYCAAIAGIAGQAQTATAGQGGTDA